MFLAKMWKRSIENMGTIMCCCFFTLKPVTVSLNYKYLFHGNSNEWMLSFTCTHKFLCAINISKTIWQSWQKYLYYASASIIMFCCVQRFFLLCSGEGDSVSFGQKEFQKTCLYIKGAWDSCNKIHCKLWKRAHIIDT